MLTDDTGRPPEAFPPGLYLKEEMAARGWTIDDVVARMGDGRDANIDRLCLEFVLYVFDPNLLINNDLAIRLGRAFDVSPDLWLNLNQAWRAWAKSRPEIKDGG